MHVEPEWMMRLIAIPMTPAEPLEVMSMGDGCGRSTETDPSSERYVNPDLKQLVARIDDLEAELNRKTERIETLEATVEAQAQHIADLEARVGDQAARIEANTAELASQDVELETHDERLEAQSARLETLEDDLTTTAKETDAALKKADANKRRIRELQTRELEKGAHLETATVDPAEIDAPNGRLEKLTKDDGRTYYRLPDRDDPLHRADTALAHGDLLPIQQLARLDEEMRRSATNALPTRLAAALWEARADPTVGDDPWKQGCKDIEEYVAASDLKHWIRRQETGISESYAKKLVSRTIDAILELSNNRLAVKKRTQRKNGLEYTERRLILPADAEIPGEMPAHRPDEETETAPAPETADVHG